VGKEIPLDIEWLPFEVHPETPPEGKLLTDMFPGTIFEKFYRKLARQSGVPDLPFGNAERLDNSGLALEAAEFAKETNAFELFHENLFRAHFVEEKNISHLRTLRDVAGASGLDTSALEKALLERKFAAKVSAFKDMACREGINGVPTFIINNTHRLVGAQPLEGFRNLLKRLDK
jgi:predicted DsbA family dithiol-disulfide isomerase